MSSDEDEDFLREQALASLRKRQQESQNESQQEFTEMIIAEGPDINTDDVDEVVEEIIVEGDEDGCSENDEEIIEEEIEDDEGEDAISLKSNDSFDEILQTLEQEPRTERPVIYHKNKPKEELLDSTSSRRRREERNDKEYNNDDDRDRLRRDRDRDRDRLPRNKERDRDYFNESSMSRRRGGESSKYDYEYDSNKRGDSVKFNKRRSKSRSPPSPSRNSRCTSTRNIDRDREKNDMRRRERDHRITSSNSRNNMDYEYEIERESSSRRMDRDRDRVIRESNQDNKNRIPIPSLLDNITDRDRSSPESHSLSRLSPRSNNDEKSETDIRREERMKRFNKNFVILKAEGSKKLKLDSKEDLMEEAAEDQTKSKIKKKKNKDKDKKKKSKEINLREYDDEDNEDSVPNNSIIKSTKSVVLKPKQKIEFPTRKDRNRVESIFEEDFNDDDDEDSPIKSNFNVIIPKMSPPRQVIKRTVEILDSSPNSNSSNDLRNKLTNKRKLENNRIFKNALENVKKSSSGRKVSLTYV